MLNVWADMYVQLGEHIHDTRVVWMGEPRPLTDEEKDTLKFRLTWMLQVCKDSGLTVSEVLIAKRINDLPESGREFDLLVDAVKSELKARLFLFVPSHLDSYYDSRDLVSQKVHAAFPTAAVEIREAGTAFAAGLNTACVFHSMRAAEIGVRALGTALGVTFPSHPIELAEWHNILDQADSKIAAMKALPRGTHKDEYLSFCSQAAIQFRYFKDGWRVRATHARATYNEGQAKEVIDQLRSFFETLAIQLQELPS